MKPEVKSLKRPPGDVPTMPPVVAAFTDTYLPTVNGVTYTIKSWRDCWRERGGRMDVVYPHSEYDPEDGEFPVRSAAFPFYDGYRVGSPSVPDAVRDADVVHAHTAFSLGLGALRLARDRDTPMVATYPPPTAEYTDYFTDIDPIADGLERLSQAYERWYLDRADLVLAPTEPAREYLRESVAVSTPVRVLSNGVDVERFRPADAAAFRDCYDLDGPLVGYTGRHGYEKRLFDLIDAAADLDATVVFGGDGPARAGLERRAEETDADVRFLGFLDREELPAFYSALDVFAFPSPVETQGLVALEANACGAPVVGANAGALADTVVDGETGYHFEAGDVDGLVAGVQRAIDERDRLSGACLERRDSISVEHTVDELVDIYAELDAPTPVSR
jgi:glycosyltransferase involved in cell wall biosynthesis